MPLCIAYIQRFADVLEPVRRFLARDRDLFAKPRIVVPTAGAKAWLWSEMAKMLGADGGVGPGHPGGDGIVANVEISYPGTILTLLQPPPGTTPDPWSFDRLTFAILEVISGPDAADLKIPLDIDREPLLVARRIAGLFDEYHVRRPGMILEWDSATPSRHMSPTANDEQKEGVPIPDLLPDQDRWQFDLWRLVRRRLAAESPPRRATAAHRSPHAPLLVAGLQSLSWPQLQALQELGAAGEVEALLVHPSPGLRAVWQSSGPQPLPEKLRGRPLRRLSRKGEAEAEEPELAADIDPLPATWLVGARDLQGLIASQDVAVRAVADTTAPPPTSLLHRMQAAVADGRLPDPAHVPAHDPAADRSIFIHRCHSLSRQAEVLHEALLHAFADPALAGLAPHDVVIMSPCLDEAAPHLEAVFQRTVVGQDAAGKDGKISLPLVVADRGLRDTSPAIDLLSRVLALPASRCRIDDVLAVAAHPLVRPHLGVDDDTVRDWTHLLERSQVRWGLDHAHRERCGLAIGDTALRDVHTWKAGIEQMLLGATLPDAAAAPELGGVVPLDDLDPADVTAVATLARVLDALADLAGHADRNRPVSAWCDALETILVALCGERCPELAEPFAQLRRLRTAAGAAAADRGIAFEEVRTLLADWFAEQAGRQPLRTGAITATSMVPLRGVPFRVVCVIGCDDPAFGAADPSKDDLVARMPLVGDGDPRADQRRSLLDCLLAARDRLIVTCTGRDVKTNEVVPLVTPLAELVDFAVRHGVAREKPTSPSAIEIDHPRHHLGRRNFRPGGVQPALIWSHDAIARDVAAAAAKPAATAVRPAERRQEEGFHGERQKGPTGHGHVGPPGKLTIEIATLEHFVRDPLGLYLRHSFNISTWRKDESATPATLPLEFEDGSDGKLTLELVDLLASHPAKVDPWRRAVRQSGRLPLGPHGAVQLREIEALAAGIVARAGRRRCRSKPWRPIR